MVLAKRKGSLICLYAANAMVYSFNALFYCFLPIYFNGLFPPEQAGIILSIGPAVSIVSPLFWGNCPNLAQWEQNLGTFYHSWGT